ncbi:MULTISPECIES: SHOCT domain-containing protein [Streptomyces]|uniref:Integral membrane protein n=1 Tax=Streptomyces coelicolor (strain ATCC BAA-471 / A3(2) / M145) TaxID=100226 RepID=O86495_STRCO|nr:MULTISPECIES: SHOCT domain-containing protein [Streptomyces]MDX2928593.1 SHOCT domain-containing protein [Streptomyces sp. NRRL_B-16638]MDX3366587.1 SHOCT domain-containing protein [Streptomyces sp. ME02-6987-2C]MDX3404697.1 SHOCT domain-containing protein [Streptomyces sp. ME02-6977A]MDX3425557.1 SHOCT domain-containing protein [Streptomyces sp. ME02-6985-2c]MYU45839.1 SHOCT domain-containing protein [Streptomyces sp. SID7813]
MSAQTYLAYDYPLLGAFWTMLMIFLWIMWFVLLFRVVTDIFRDDGLSGWAKAGWLVFCILLPFLGVFVYVIARGKNMGSRETTRARAQQEEFDAYIRKTVGGGSSSVDELARLSEIRDRGAITDEEFRKAKELVLSGHGPAGHTGAAGTGASAR